ncbi:MAG TPA: YdcF family protein [Streptosporangiaceae bacterium]|nr:YdcF family protein [Streptosporangiaceae bacterium]
MTSVDLTAEQISQITAYVDVDAPPPDAQASAVFIFGTNQLAPAEIAAQRHRLGLAPLIIATGGVNRHNGVIEAREFQKTLIEQGVDDEVIRVEDQSANTWQNVELALPYLREATSAGLPVTAICKWYHRRAVHILKTIAPQIGAFHVVTWEPVYENQFVTRTTWPDIPDGKRRVVREWEEVSRRVADGSFTNAAIIDGAWY